MTRPLVSVVIPCFNYARFLDDALGSLVRQTCPDWEAVVVDDGSTDDTPDVARTWMDRDPRIVYVRQRRRRLAGARNRGLDLVRGRYVQFLDADDLLGPGKFATQIAALRRLARPGLCYSDYRILTEGPEGAELRGPPVPARFAGERALHDVALRWETQVSVPIHCHLFDTRLLDACGARFDERLGNHEDWLFLLQVLRSAPPVVRVPEPFAVYRLHAGSMTRDDASMRTGFLRAIGLACSTFRDDAEMLRILAEKRRVTRHAYRHVSPAVRLTRAVRRPLGRALPAPVKRLLRGGPASSA